VWKPREQKNEDLLQLLLLALLLLPLEEEHDAVPPRANGVDGEFAAVVVDKASVRMPRPAELARPPPMALLPLLPLLLLLQALSSAAASLRRIGFGERERRETKKNEKMNEVKQRSSQKKNVKLMLRASTLRFLTYGAITIGTFIAS